MQYIIDLVTIGILTTAIVMGKQRGFLKSSYNILSFVITAILILTLQQPFCDYLSGSTLGENIRIKVNEQVLGSAEKDSAKIEGTDDAETAIKVGEVMGLPSFMMNFLDEKLQKQTEAVETMKNDALTTLSAAVTELILKIISILLLFVMVRVCVFLLLHILNIIFKMPILKSINSILGIAIGTVNGLIVIYIICAVITLLIPTDSVGSIVNMIDSTLITKYFYHNNLLIEIFI